MTVRAIWAQTLSGVIGDGEKLLWHLPEDMKFFKDTTHNQTVVMGRKTWDSLPAKFRPLPNRKNIVVSRTTSSYEGAESVTDVADLLKNSDEDLWVIGGSQIYAAALEHVDELYITQVHADINEGVLAPVYQKDFRLVDQSFILISSTGIKYQFQRWVRTKQS